MRISKMLAEAAEPSRTRRSRSAVRPFAGFKRSCQQIVAFAKPSPCLLVFCMLSLVMHCLQVRVRACTQSRAGGRSHCSALLRRFF